MCSTPDAPDIKIPDPQILSNPFLDEARGDTAGVSALRTGRSALRIPLDTGLGIGFGARTGGISTTSIGSISGNNRRGPGLLNANEGALPVPFRGNNPRGGVSTASGGSRSANLRIF